MVHSAAEHTEHAAEDHVHQAHLDRIQQRPTDVRVHHDASLGAHLVPRGELVPQQARLGRRRVVFVSGSGRIAVEVGALMRVSQK